MSEVYSLVAVIAIAVCVLSFFLFLLACGLVDVIKKNVNEVVQRYFDAQFDLIKRIADNNITPPTPAPRFHYPGTN